MRLVLITTLCLGLSACQSDNSSQGQANSQAENSEPAESAEAPSVRNGQFREGAEDAVWHADSAQWISPVEFWERFAATRGERNWGRRSDYPPYGDVEELDTLLIEIESGPCLMEFFHSRWRRANDVRRWDERFNAYGGCPRVFD